ncbi:helix-turn-helix transcriptional regulator [Clostridium scatologenes]|uniref:Helix-turn-helix type 11 domain protein n=1 Tax=Clostridium scatologenes TaxID=1548 RepID=A0A0E3K485_CLOSL|nr:YafY family protein [Clostridium scatologenes]AKA71774.1 Helix-turn-helix type 11 domain protein [Clostridium scatologenes]
MSKISHLIEMIITLQYKGLTTATELAETLEVDKKTIYRYINSLNKANIPVHTKKGRYGGFYIDQEFYMKPSKLNKEELQSLLMSTQILTKENGFIYEKDLQTAVTKIKSLCVNSNDELKYLNENGNFKINEAGGLQNLQDKISQINYAMSRGRTLSINYFSANKNNLTIKKVDPYNLIFREGAWYIIGYYYKSDRVESFKISRIQNLKITDEIYMIPHTFSLKTYLEDNWAVFKGDKNKVIIKFDKNISDFIENGKWHPDEQLQKLDDGSLLLIMYLDEFQEVKNWILGFGKNAEVIEPVKFREEIKKEIEDMYKKY